MYQEQESLAYCSGQCQASRYPPATCRCPCQGRNHGVLRFRNPSIDVTPYGYVNEDTPLPLKPGYFLPRDRQVLGLPEIKRKIDPGISLPPARPRGHSLTRKIARSLKQSLVGYSQDDLNSMILKGLRNQFNQDRIDSIIDQAFSIRMSKEPDRNRPELYELYETGEIDKALELFGTRWVIGRPKIRK